jgi:hypothetical protein
MLRRGGNLLYVEGDWQDEKAKQEIVSGEEGRFLIPGCFTE